MSGNKGKLNEQLLNVVLNERDDISSKMKKMKYLLRLGADVEAKVYGKSLLSWGIKNNIEPEVRDFLVENGAKEWEISQGEAEKLGLKFWDNNGNAKSFEEIKEMVAQGACLRMGVWKGRLKRIWKELTFDEINEILKSLPNGYEIHGDVNLRGLGFTKLPDFSKIKVSGCFDCSHNLLETLEGAPKEVGDCFYCYENKLSSLKGKPKKIGKGFYIEDEVMKKIKENEKENTNSFWNRLFGGR